MKSRFVLVPGALVIFLAGLLIGQEVSSTTTMEGQIVRLNHVAIRVPDFERSADFYQKKLGFPLAYRFDDENGNLIFAYFQISKSTFIELLPADESHPAGIDHFGLETERMDSVLAYFEDLGIEATESKVSPYTRVNLAHAKDPDGVYFELIEAVEGSDLHRAMNAWKQ